ncbi:16588_t:CDS:2 [Cetraspora pellucida]|uniref:16588_t:CDS:1 n=1 Tax=Cetraspora pellucida TaxID=1433469 RepID=A0A9N9NNA4_9GLOM|nr:16588_t:CDS:2 [Cetraspora pellucida]
MKLERYKESLVDLNKVLEIDPSNVLALIEHGSIHYILKNFTLSYEDWNKASKIQKEYEESLTDLNMLLGIEPNNVQLLEQRAYTYEMLEQNYEQSLEDWKRRWKLVRLIQKFSSVDIIIY